MCALLVPLMNLSLVNVTVYQPYKRTQRESHAPDLVVNCVHDGDSALMRDFGRHTESIVARRR